MNQLIRSRCGIFCTECRYREKMKCPGCMEAKGQVFWGECALATCSVQKGLAGCEECPEMPCERLKEFSYDKKQGDNGQRIENLRAWKVSGFDAWAKGRQKHK